MKKEEISKVLQEGKSTLTFKKKDGTTRIMECTLDTSIIPPAPEKKTERVKKPNDEVLSVWDLENKVWRSFRIENFISIQPK